MDILKKYRKFCEDLFVPSHDHRKSESQKRKEVAGRRKRNRNRKTHRKK